MHGWQNDQGCRRPQRYCGILALFVLAVVSLLSPNTAIGSPIDAETLKAIPTSKLSNAELVELFLSEPPYRWQSQTRIFVDYRQDVSDKYRDCINDYILEQLKEDPRTKIVDYVVASDRGDANLVVEFDPSFRIEDCPSKIEVPALRIVQDPPRAMTCIILLVEGSKIDRAVVTVHAGALWDNLSLFKYVQSNYCAFPGLVSAISYSTGVYALKRFRVKNFSYVEYKALEVAFAQILYSGKLDRLTERSALEAEILKMIERIR